jgi:hypothetical protein
MAAATCALCGTGFSARSDAIYCSSACRQKAHRARTARRIAALGERLRQASRPAPIKLDAAKAQRRSPASSLQRARERIDKSHQLCAMSEQRIQRATAIRQQLANLRLATGTAPATTSALTRGQPDAAPPPPSRKRGL